MVKQESALSCSSSLSGNAADRESSSSEEGCSTSLNSTGKRDREERSRSIQEKSKQKRLREETYAAAHAHEEIKRARGHLTVPKIGQNKYFNVCIDLTTVKHFLSSEVPPFVKDTREDPRDFKAIRMYALEAIALYEAMFRKCRPFYHSKVENKVKKQR